MSESIITYQQAIHWLDAFLEKEPSPRDDNIDTPCGSEEFMIKIGDATLLCEVLNRMYENICPIYDTRGEPDLYYSNAESFLTTAANDPFHIPPEELFSLEDLYYNSADRILHTLYILILIVHSDYMYTDPYLWEYTDAYHSKNPFNKRYNSDVDISKPHHCPILNDAENESSKYGLQNSNYGDESANTQYSDATDTECKSPAVSVFKSKSDYRLKIINELLLTERAYVDALQSIMEGYYEYLLSYEKLSVADRKIIFGNIPEIYSMQKKFLIQLESSILENPDHIARCFIEAEDDFSIYSDYCTNHPDALKTLEQYTSDPEFNSLLGACQHVLKQPLGLQGALLKPVQRILKYPLLFKEILKTFESETEDGYSQMEEALQCVMRIAEMINETKRKHDNLYHVIDLQSRLLGYSGPDLTTLGPLFKDQSFKVLDYRDRKTERHLILFEKMLLFAKEISGKNQGYGSKPTYNFKASIEISKMMIRKIKDKDGDDDMNFLWEISRSGDKKIRYLILSTSAADKEAWTSLLEKLIMESLTSFLASKARPSSLNAGSFANNLENNSNSVGSVEEETRDDVAFPSFQRFTFSRFSEEVGSVLRKSLSPTVPSRISVQSLNQAGLSPSSSMPPKNSNHTFLDAQSLSKLRESSGDDLSQTKILSQKCAAQIPKAPKNYLRKTQTNSHLSPQISSSTPQSRGLPMQEPSPPIQTSLSVAGAQNSPSHDVPPPPSAGSGKVNKRGIPPPVLPPPRKPESLGKPPSQLQKLKDDPLLQSAFQAPLADVIYSGQMTRGACVNKCGFYGSPELRNLCSKCFHLLFPEEAKLIWAGKKANVSLIDDDILNYNPLLQSLQTDVSLPSPLKPVPKPSSNVSYTTGAPRLPQNSSNFFTNMPSSSNHPLQGSSHHQYPSNFSSAPLRPPMSSTTQSQNFIRGSPFSEFPSSKSTPIVNIFDVAVVGDAASGWSSTILEASKLFPEANSTSSHKPAPSKQDPFPSKYPSERNPQNHIPSSSSSSSLSKKPFSHPTSSMALNESSTPVLNSMEAIEQEHMRLLAGAVSSQQLGITPVPSRSLSGPDIRPKPLVKPKPKLSPMTAKAES